MDILKTWKEDKNNHSLKRAHKWNAQILVVYRTNKLCDLLVIRCFYFIPNIFHGQSPNWIYPMQIISFWLFPQSFSLPCNHNFLMVFCCCWCFLLSEDFSIPNSTSQTHTRCESNYQKTNSILFAIGGKMYTLSKACLLYS